jgi:hypothetical protein
VPRVSRLLALALRIDEQVRKGELTSYAEVAVLGHVTRARVSQIMNLLNLAPDLQEAILFLPRTQRGRDAIILRELQPIASIVDWRKQRAGLVAARASSEQLDNCPEVNGRCKPGHKEARLMVAHPQPALDAETGLVR